MKKKAIIASIMVLIVVGSTINSTNTEAIDGYFFKLRIVIPSPGGYNPDYGLFISQQLREINIDSDVIAPYGWLPSWYSYLKDYNIEWDLAIVSAGNIESPDMGDYYMTEGEKNVFGLNSQIPFNNNSEELQELASSTLDLEQRYQYMFEWNQLFMDKILPLLPTFCPREYEATWANTMGFDARWGLSDSLPYMHFDGYHDGQQNTSIFNIDGYNWNNINPLYEQSEMEKYLGELLFEPLIIISPDISVLKNGIIKKWSQIDDYHYIFELRDNIWWNPSYNITTRNSSSIPLNLIPDNDLLIGLKDEYSNSSNQQVKAKDAVFTLLAMSNSNVSEIASKYNWLSKCYVDPVNDLKFHVVMDAFPETPANEIYVDFWSRIAVPILPEFYLNSTSLNISQTTGGQEYIGLYPGITETTEWLAFQKSPFGCGKYVLDYYLPDNITVLQKSSVWFGIGAIDGTIQDLDIVTINIPFSYGGELALADFREGKLDWISLTILPEQRKTMQADPRFDVQTYINYKFNFVAFNLESSKVGGINNYIWLNETGKTEYTRAVAIRKAICYAIDRKEINEDLHNGEYLVVHFANPRIPMPYYGTDYVKYNHDLDLAWEWLEAAGYERPYTPTSTENSSTIDFEVFFSLFGLIVIYLLKKKSKKNFT